MLGLLERHATFWSVDRPDFDGTKSGADVDCIVLSGGHLWLLDMKFYRAGDMTYKTYGSKLIAIDNKTGKQVGEPRDMSRNMEIAKLSFSTLAGPRSIVKTAVVLIPTEGGTADIAPGSVWHGDVPLMTLPALLKELQSARPYNDHVQAGLRKDLRMLVKG